MLTAFTASLLLITTFELGDKSFFITMCLAMRHNRRYVYAGVMAALIIMTVFSVALGQFASLLPKTIWHYASVLLLMGFGFKLLYEAVNMRPECQDKTLDLDDTAVECLSDAEREAIEAVTEAERKLKKKTPFAICLEAFLLTFVAEWGDRTQFATIALAASNSAVGVTLGAISGHAICSLIAVIGGRLIAGRISERMITLIGGILFLVFAAADWYEGV